MQKKLISVLGTIFFGLFFYSCSDPILPKRIEIKGTVNLPVRMGVANFGSTFTDLIEEAFSSQTADVESLNIKVFNVEHDELEVQTFCIYLPISMTENLNPNDFLKTINKQLNNNLSNEPRDITFQIPVPPVFPPGGYIDIDLNTITLDTIPPIYLDNIAKYVNYIDFDRCDESVESGIGINFEITEILPGLAMKVICDNLKFPEAAQPLGSGDNIFGNSEALSLVLAEYLDRQNGKKLEFKMELQSTTVPNNPKTLRLNTSDLTPGVPIKINGKLHFFQNWTHASIDLVEAIKSSSQQDRFTGTFPGEDNYFNLSELKNYISGGFVFNGLKIKMYMGNNPIDIRLSLVLDPVYDGKPERENALYDGEFSIDDEPLILDDHLNEEGIYISKSLPGDEEDTPENAGIDRNIIADILDIMPHDLTFRYQIRFEQEELDITPDTFVKASNDDSKITLAMMLWLPLSLTAQGDSVITLPGMFDNINDLLGRDRPGDFSVKVQTIKMTIDFLSPIFSGGSLFIDGDSNGDIEENNPKLFFPGGIKLGEKRGKQGRIVVNFTEKELETIQGNLIKPNIWIKFKEDDTIEIPKNLGVLGIKFEMKGIQIGEEFFK